MERRVVEKQLSFCHFGHEHPLQNTNSPPKENSLCSACNLNISASNNKDYYACKTCPFFLHKVCHNMPKKTQHPSHPNHYLTLQISPSIPSTKPLKCEACEDQINGYYYSCEECSLFYHVLCSALPLSISVSCHTHELKLTFSPPYNFSCDICNKPSYVGIGWLYRCQICEFDSHLMCAVSSRKAQSFSRSSLGITKRISVDYRNEVDEVMQLVTERVKINQELRLQSCKENRHSTSPVFDQKESNSGVDVSPYSVTTSTFTSFQNSDACFSIDLARSYSGYDPTKRASCTENNCCENENHQLGTKLSSGHEVEGKAIIGSYRNISHKTNLEPSGVEQQKQLGINVIAHNYSFNVGRDERLRQAFLVKNDTLTREELGQKGKKGRSDFGKQSKDKSRSSNWPKLLCFCYAS